MKSTNNIFLLALEILNFPYLYIRMLFRKCDTIFTFINGVYEVIDKNER